MYAGEAYVFVREGSSWELEAPLQRKKPPQYSWEGLGTSVAIEGDTAVVGSPAFEPAAGGSAFVYVRTGSTWSQEKRIKPSDGTIGNFFGWSVSMSGDMVFVGAPWLSQGVCATYLYRRVGTTWSELMSLAHPSPGSRDEWGSSVAISGGYVVVGARTDSTPAGLYSGSAFAYRVSTAPTTYCTAGTSVSGCQATLSASGSASATAPTGFDLTATGMEGAKDGLFFFGTNGRQANPWGNGTSYQCVVPPVNRGGILQGTGTPGQCDGMFSQDLNARWTAKPNQNPGAGATVQAQLWYRDPFNTSNQTTSLSDAIEFVMAP
jgi:hypothetical protein